MTNVRSSSASCGSWSGASMRRSRGQLTLSRRGVGRSDGLMRGFSRRSILREGGTLSAQRERPARGREERGERASEPVGALGGEVERIVEERVRECAAREGVDVKRDALVAEATSRRIHPAQAREIPGRREARGPALEELSL